MMVSNAEYWSRRFALLEQNTYDQTTVYLENLKQQYALACDSINKELAIFYARFADEEGVSYTEAQRLLNSEELAAFHMRVEEYIKLGKQNAVSFDKDVAKALERASTKYRVTRLEALEMQLKAEVAKLYEDVDAGVYEAAAQAYTDRYYRSIYEVSEEMSVGATFARLDDKQIKAVLKKPWASDGLNFSDRVWRDKRALMDEMPTVLTQGIIRGQGYKDTSKQLAERLNVKYSRASNLIRTESAFFSSEGQAKMYAELDVEEYEIVATLDTRTSEICRHMDGKVFKRKDMRPGVTAPPFHCRCRTTTCPFFDDEFTEGETRAARDQQTGKTVQVPDMTYPEWYKKYVEKNK